MACCGVIFTFYVYLTFHNYIKMKHLPTSAYFVNVKAGYFCAHTFLAVLRNKQNAACDCRIWNSLLTATVNQ